MIIGLHAIGDNIFPGCYASRQRFTYSDDVSHSGRSAMRRLVGLIVLGMVVVIVHIGCPTRYQKTGATGGYSDARIDANTFLVEFHGNGFTSRQTVETYLLYRCAEVTVEAGYDFFVVVGGGVERNDSTNTTTTPGYFSSSTSGTATTSGSAPAL